MRKIFLTIVMMMLAAHYVDAAEQDAIKSHSAESTVDISLILGTVTDDTNAGEHIDKNCIAGLDKKLAKDAIVPISGVHVCKGINSYSPKAFYEVMISGKPYYLDQAAVLLKEADIKSLDSMTAESFPPLAEIAKSASNKIFSEETEGIIAEREAKNKKLEVARAALDATSKHGLTILKNAISDTSKYTEGTGFIITIGNPSTKSIQYVSFTVIGYNAVDEPVLDPIKLTTEITVRGIGPINKNESMAYDWEYMWHTDLVERFEIKEIKLQYMDGSKRTIKNISEITLNEQDYETIYGNN